MLFILRACFTQEFSLSYFVYVVNQVASYVTFLISALESIQVTLLGELTRYKPPWDMHRKTLSCQFFDLSAVITMGVKRGI